MSSRPAARGRAVASLWLALLMGCSTASVPGTSASPAPGPVVTVPPTTVAIGAEVADGAEAVGGESVAVSVPRVVASSSSTVSGGPFGAADLWIGAGPQPVGLQRSLGAGDLPGPFLNLSHAGVGDFRVFDMCGPGEAPFREGGDFSSVAYRSGYNIARRLHKGCTQSRFMAVAQSPMLSGNQRQYFDLRSEAESWLAEWRNEHWLGRASEDSSRVGPPAGAFPMGFVSSEFPAQRVLLGTVFAPVDAPVDEVRALGWSVHVRDGVLRGLVRNWSRRLWAYEVAITAEDRTFLWPLSVQPGEIAPFEISGWQGPTDPEAIDIVATADMSLHVDPSRAHADDVAYAGYENLPHYRIEVSGQGWERYSDVWDETEAGAVAVGLFTWRLRRTVPDSHPSLADNLESLHLDDLRAYGVVVDGTGRVLQVSPALLSGPEGGLEVTSYTDSGEPSGGRWEHVPFTLSDQIGPYGAVLPVFEELPEITTGTPTQEFAKWFHDYDPVTGEYRRSVGHYGGFVIWIGAAHPSRPVS